MVPGGAHLHWHSPGWGYPSTRPTSSARFEAIRCDYLRPIGWQHPGPNRKNRLPSLVMRKSYGTPCDIGPLIKSQIGSPEDSTSIGHFDNGVTHPSSGPSSSNHEGNSTDRGLALLVESWPLLTDEVKAQLVGIIVLSQGRPHVVHFPSAPINPSPRLPRMYLATYPIH